MFFEFWCRVYQAQKFDDVAYQRQFIEFFLEDRENVEGNELCMTLRFLGRDFGTDFAFHIDAIFRYRPLA